MIVLDTNPDGAKETVDLIASAGGKASAMKLDVTDRAACQAAAAEIAKAGNISILVNNAGINRRNPMTADPAVIGKDWDDILSINLDGMFNVTRAFLDQLRATRGRIVNIGSIQSFVHVAWPNSAAYTTSKHGVLGFTRALAAELGKDGVRVNAIGPGLIETRINAEARAKNPDMVAKVMWHTPLGRARQARGYRRTGGVPRLRHVGLCYGLHHHGRRRLPHGLTDFEQLRQTPCKTATSAPASSSRRSMR